MMKRGRILGGITVIRVFGLILLLLMGATRSVASEGPESDPSNVYWDDLETGMAGGHEDTSVRALVMDTSGYLYAAGNFATAGGVTVNHIARWDGTSWSALGTGMDWSSIAVYALTVDGAENVYAGGGFTISGDVSAKNVAKWDGSSWSAMGSGMNDSVNALTVDSSGNVYAGGFFTTAGGVAANHISKWDGTSWSTLETGMNVYGVVLALTFDSSGNLYAGGEFTTAGGVNASNIAKWNGTSWSALGDGTDGRVRALVVDGSGNLYAGGEFTTADGSVTVNHIARWDGTSWSALGTGTNDVVIALTVDRNVLMAGGSFSLAGGKASSCFAEWQPKVNRNQISMSANPGGLTLGNDLYGFYKPALRTSLETTVSYGDGLPVTVVLSRADEIHVFGHRVNGAFTLGPEGVRFGGAGATLRVEFSEDDVVAFGYSATDFFDFGAVRLTYPANYPTNKEASSIISISNGTPGPIRIENGRQIYAITVPFPEIASTYGVVPNFMASTQSLSVTPTSQNVPSVAGSTTFEIHTTASWTASSDQAWATISNPSGTGNATLTVNYEENTGASSRSANIIVTGVWTTPSSITVRMIQGTPVALSVTPSSQPVSAAAGPTTFEIHTTASWTASSDQAWATISNPSGTGNATLTVNYEENTGSSRSAIITVTGIGTMPGSVQVTLNQATPILSVTPSSRSVSALSGSTTFEIQTTAPWTASSDQTWATISNPSGTGNATLTINYEADTGSSRSATITITGTGTTPSSLSVTVTQSANIPLSVSPAGWSVSSMTGLTTFEIHTTASWTASSDQTWATISNPSGTGNATLTVNYEENSGSSRSAIITVTGTQTIPSSMFVSVTQAVGGQSECEGEGEEANSPWSPLGEGVLGLGVNALAMDGVNTLYVGGTFFEVGGIYGVEDIAKWDVTTSTWSALGTGTANAYEVDALAVDTNGILYVGGDFVAIGDVTAHMIAQWNGSQWSEVGTSGGLSGTVYALTVDRSRNILYAGGSFSETGDGLTYLFNVAQWHNGLWSPLGTGINNGTNGPVFALAVDDSGYLYAGGRFNKAGGETANYVAKWDGIQWSHLETGMDSWVSALALDRSGNLYAGGPFTLAGGVMANRIAKWDGTSWSTLGTGMNSQVYELAVDQSSGDLYAGGIFTTAGGMTVNGIAKWNGETWSGLGTGL
ncbi:MAG TPA: BACON domain-containing carbohydrate-binding protein, partial [Candidatus Hydrogenedentes bacterium]|nr:BACON domain-containing carbohydrate-binding protein [Candidatus Hydrogenedentota bacterium]